MPEVLSPGDHGAGAARRAAHRAGAGAAGAWWPCRRGAVGTRWYLRRAPAGYLAERASYSQINASIAEAAEGARTVEALGLQAARVALTEGEWPASYRAERYTLFLRTVWFPTVEASYALPVVATVVAGGLLPPGAWCRSAR